MAMRGARRAAHNCRNQMANALREVGNSFMRSSRTASLLDDQASRAPRDRTRRTRCRCSHAIHDTCYSRDALCWGGLRVAAVPGQRLMMRRQGPRPSMAHLRDALDAIRARARRPSAREAPTSWHFQGTPTTARVVNRLTMPPSCCSNMHAAIPRERSHLFVATAAWPSALR